jgi:hypothetical protein
MNSNLKQVKIRLSHVRRRLILQYTLKILCVSLSIGLVWAILILYGIAQGWRGSLVLWNIYGCVLLPVMSLSVSIFFYYRRWSSDLSIAHYLEAYDPYFKDALMTCVDAIDQKEIGGHEFITVLASRTSNYMNTIALNQWVPWRVLRKSALILVMIITLSGGAWSASDLALQQAWQTLIQKPEWVTHKISHMPLIGDIRLMLYPPAYTQLPPKAIDYGSGDFEAFIGSRVRLEATSIMPCQQAKIIWGDLKDPIHKKNKSNHSNQVANQIDTHSHVTDQDNTQVLPNRTALPLTVLERIVSGDFNIDHSEKWRISLVDLQGVQWLESSYRQIMVKLDRVPKVKITNLQSGTKIDPQKDLDLEVMAHDDFGLTQASIAIALAHDMEHPEVIPMQVTPAKKWKLVDRLDLRMIQAQGGDKIAIWVEVTDNKAVGDGPQKVQSEVIFLEVDSPQQEHTEILDALRENMEQQLNALADRLELDQKKDQEGQPIYLQELSNQVKDETEVDDERIIDPKKIRPSYLPANQQSKSSFLISQWMHARQATQEALQSLGEIIERMGQDELTPQAIYLAFINRETKFTESLAIEGRLMNEKSKRQQLDQLTLDTLISLEKEVMGEIEAVIILIEAMVARMALEEMANLAKELQQTQAHIRDMIQAYKDQPSDALKTRIRRELQRFKQKMQRMREMMKRLQKKLPEEFLNLDGMKSDEVMQNLKDTAEQVDSIEDLLEKGELDKALAALDDMSNQLEAMSQKLKEDMEELHRQSNPELEKALSELMDETRDLMKSQQQLKKDSLSQQEAMDQAMDKALQKDWKDPLAELKAKVKRLSKLEEQAKMSANGLYVERLRNKLKKGIQDLQRSVDQTQLPEALDSAQRSRDSFERLKQIDARERRSQVLMERRSQRANGIRNDRSPKQAVNEKHLLEGSSLSQEILDTLEKVKTKLSEVAQKAQQKEEQKQDKRRASQKEEQQGHQSKQGSEGKQDESQASQNQKGQQGQEGQPSPKGQQGNKGNTGQKGQSMNANPWQANPSQTPGDRLSHRQDQISEGLQKLKQKLDAKKQKIPALNQVEESPFEQAQQASQEASEKLKSQPSHGQMGQNQVLESLKQVMEGLKNSKKPQKGQGEGKQQQDKGQGKGQGQGQQRSSSRGKNSQEKVEIPQGSSQGPEAFRKAILDAMKSKPAAGYDAQVKAYYESLVR